MKTTFRLSQASGRTQRRVEDIIRCGTSATKHAWSAPYQRKLAERLDYDR